MLYSESTAIIAKIILMVAKTVGVPGSLLLAICVHETKLTRVIAINDGDSDTFGVCQIKHETAQMLGFKGTSEELMRTSINAEFAAKYLKYQLKRYNGDTLKATAAYNAGSYIPSTKVLGKPRNFEYIEKVNKILENKNILNYDERKMASK